MDRRAWTDADWRTLFEERAGIRQRDGGYERAAAEVMAYRDVIEAYREATGARREVVWRRLGRLGVG
jgi:hypothetical protein